MDDQESTAELQKSLHDLRCLNRIIEKISNVRGPNHIMSIIVDELVGLTQSDQGVINLITPSSTENVLTLIRQADADTASLPSEAANLISGWVVQHRRPLTIDDLDHDDRFPGLSSEDGRYQSVLSCPITARADIVGLLILVRGRAQGRFDDDAVHLATKIVGQAAHVLANALLIEELARKNEQLQIAQRQLRAEISRLRSELSGDCE